MWKVFLSQQKSEKLAQFSDFFSTFAADFLSQSAW